MKKDDIRVLVIEDESDIRTLLLHQLAKEGYAARGAATGEEGLALARDFHPDLIVLDLMLPGMDGMAVCRKLRKMDEVKTALILMLTARKGEEDMVSGLEAGADDYIGKPFSSRVLMAKIRSLLRRGGVYDDDEPEESMAVGPIRLVPERREATVSGRKMDLTAGEFKMLQVLMRRPGVVFTRAQLLDLVRGAFHAVTDRAVDMQVVGLRRKLGDAGGMIETVRGVGYRLVEERT